MDDICVLIGCVQMWKLQVDLEKCVCVRSKYIEEFFKIGGFIVLFVDNIEFVLNYIMLVVLVNLIKDKRDKIRNRIYVLGI